jgi:hypothetical protein
MCWLAARLEWSIESVMTRLAELLGREARLSLKRMHRKVEEA